MYIVMGGTGHIGSAVAAELLDRGNAVTIVTRNVEKAAHWKTKGARLVKADTNDPESLKNAFRHGKCAFLLNPPADVSQDTDAVEHRSVRAILDALEGSGLERVVAESVYGAHPGTRCGDLGVLYAFEEGLRAQAIPAGIVRAAYYMSNWDAMLPVAKKTGTLQTLFPADLDIPMVAPADVGRVVADLLTAPSADTSIHYAEGPRRYSASDVANAFGRVLGRKVDIKTIPRDEWEEAFRRQGFSELAAASYAGMTAVTVDEAYALPDDPIRGRVTLEGYLEASVSSVEG